MVEPSGGSGWKRKRIVTRFINLKGEDGEAKRKEGKESKSSFNSKSFDTCLRRNLYDTVHFCIIKEILLLFRFRVISTRFSIAISRNDILKA